MGRDFSASVATGFWYDHEEIEKPFKQIIEEVFHNETRYDELTGEPKLIKVVDNEPGERVIYKSEDLTGDPIQLVEIICGDLKERLGFEVVYWSGGDWYDGTMLFVIGPNVPSENDEVDPMVFRHEQFHAQAKQIGQALREMGMPERDFRIHALELVS